MEAGAEEKQWTIPTGLIARLNKAIAEDLENVAHKAPETLLPTDADPDSPATSQGSSFYDKIGSETSLHTDDSDKSGGSSSSTQLSARAQRKRSRSKKRKKWGAESRVHDKNSDVSWEKQTFVTEAQKPAPFTASSADDVCKFGDRAAGTWTRYPPMAKLHKTYGGGGASGAGAKK